MFENILLYGLRVYYILMKLFIELKKKIEKKVEHRNKEKKQK